MATISEPAVAEAGHLEDVGVGLEARIREFLWLFSGMFSAASLSLAFLAYFTLGAAEDAARNFAAAIVSSALFGLCTLLKLGPDSA